MPALSGFTAGTCASAHALILGIDGPHEIRRANSPALLLTTIYLGDRSVPSGIELRLWASMAISATSFRVMDVLHVQNANGAVDNRSKSLYLKCGGLTKVSRVPSASVGNDAAEVFKWRSEQFSELVRMTEQGKVRSRPFLKVGGKGQKKEYVGGIGRGERVEKKGVRIVGIRIRRYGGERGEVFKELVRMVCTQCGTKWRPGGRRCKCVGMKCGWGWGEMWVILKDEEGKEVCVLARGDTVGRLMVGIGAEEVWKGEVAKVEKVLRAMLKDEGGFRVALKGGGEGVLLEDLYVDRVGSEVMGDG